MLSRRLLLACAIGACWLGFTGACASELLDIGTQRQVFLDGRFIESSRGVELTVNRPQVTGEKLIECDRPWERMFAGGYMTVIQEGNRLRMWYACGDQDGLGFVAYAESTDGGATWRKPSLGVVEYQGSTDNNIVLDGVHGTTVFRNRPDAPEDQRYGLFSGNPNRLYVSADGYHWTQSGQEPFLDLSAVTDTPTMMNFHLDSQNVMFWDERINQYVVYPRLNLKPSQTQDQWMGRTIGHTASPTLDSFPIPQIVLQRDDQDPPNLDFYTSGVTRYPYAADCYLMFPAAYHHYASPPHPGNDGPIDLQFAASRDGVHWLRPDRRPVIRQGIDGQWNDGCHYAGNGMTRQGDDLSIYFVAQDITHAEYKKRGYIRGTVTRAIYRLDGFTSIDADYQGGELVTPTIMHAGDELVLNVDGSAGGWIKVELLDERGVALDGFTQVEADAITGNAVDKLVTWSGRSDASQTKGVPLHMRFVMRDVKLYAFQWRAGQTKTTGGTSAP